MTKTTLKYRSSLIMLYVLAIAATAVFVGLLLLPSALWQFKPYRQLNVWTIDKTVPYPDFREHAGFFWILKNEKIAKPGARQLYSERSDYFGFYPYGKNEWRGVSMPTSGARPDVIYITDTYGVYKDDYMQKRLSSDLSPKLYGALNSDDILTIRRNLGAGNTLISEFNTAASPTNLSDRLTLGRLLGLNWRGWIGKYFEDLSPEGEVPVWVVTNYETQNRKKWSFFGRGYVLLSDNDDIVVLSEKEDIGAKGLKFSYQGNWGEKLGLKAPVSYRYWFEWTVPDAGAETVAEFHFDLTAAGKAKLDAIKLPDTFPAIIHTPNAQYMGWYFAGDFADMQFSTTPFKMVGIAAIKRLLADDTVDSNMYFYWQAYVPLMRHILAEADSAKAARATIAGEKTEIAVPVRAFGKGFQVRGKDGVWKDFYIRGVNMGLAEPGKYFTDFPDSVDTYRRWLGQIADMNANTIRVYTLPPPEFYKALLVHNTERPDQALYLLQELWPEEHPANGDYLAAEYQAAYLKEIDYGIDAVYGRANIPERKGRAWGIYSADVSRWLLGWLVGRELESEEVMSNDQRNKGVSFKGDYVSAGPEASPTEVWLAESLDEVASIEAARYNALHPVAMVSWPTLDPAWHDTEWDPVTGKKNKGNDRAIVTIDHLEITPAMTAGLFGAYHIYPNYPDFMNNEPSYGGYKDAEGMLRYGGYLQEFMQSHKRYPAVVAEFGMANGFGVAHIAPDGLNHGGATETQAGRNILRMYEAIKREGYAGAVIFEWMDEWVKKTWTTETLMIPYDRHVLWHNVVDPEQNYGLMANEVTPPAEAQRTYAGSGNVESMQVSADASYLNISLRLKEKPDFSTEELLIGLDTLGRGLGAMTWPVIGRQTRSGLEFVVRISSADKADLLVIPSYNAALARYATVRQENGTFERIDMLVNGAVTTKDGRRIPERRFDASALRKGAFDEAGNLWNLNGSTLSIRLPWTYLNVADPSTRNVIQDTRTGIYIANRDELKTMQSDGFVLDAIVWDRAQGKAAGGIASDPGLPYFWKLWEDTPPYRERLKKSYFIVKGAWAAEAAAAKNKADAAAK